MDKAVASARKAFDEGPWRKMCGATRGRLMNKFADLVEANIDELAILETLDNGKPLSFSKNVDFGLFLKVIRYYAGMADKIHGQTMNLSSPHFAYTREEPVGVCA